MISIIVPVLNEEKGIISLLEYLEQSSSDSRQLEILIVDGGSTDRTPVLIEEYRLSTNCFKAVTLLHSKKGRSKQMDHGAQHAQGSILYFLHADSYPPVKFDQLIIDAVNRNQKAGCFRMKFDNPNWWLFLMGWFTRFSWKVSRGGDQSQFICNKMYTKIGGYDTSLPIYEDYDLINKLYAINCYTVLPQVLTTSSRRYKDVGIFKLQWYYLNIYYRKWRGDSIQQLHEYYLKYCD
ncbi:TIGR04283 family arsenosugar biosynthesis glycosyltransferase [Nonlabens sp. SY33080]|uniref:TIGR04283 family arsenosugar biosynthesis glycosyltransferase n=1 Tax=Nonlabens sp. SY33080 TaxID=2719911 RepID=UPI001428B21A|nr:TIGR04283 family arsenosugar biosynthesis glycosyltransferase [Nonlabens sp. SY33080]